MRPNRARVAVSLLWGSRMRAPHACLDNCSVGAISQSICFIVHLLVDCPTVSPWKLPAPHLCSARGSDSLQAANGLAGCWQIKPVHLVLRSL